MNPLLKEVNDFPSEESLRSIDWQSLSTLLLRVCEAQTYGEMRKRVASPEQWKLESEHYDITLPAEFLKLKKAYTNNRETFIEQAIVKNYRKNVLEAMERLIVEEVESILLQSEETDE